MSIQLMFKQREDEIKKVGKPRPTTMPVSHKQKEHPRMSDNYDFDKLERNLKRAVQEFKDNPRVKRLGSFNHSNNRRYNDHRRDINGNR